MAIASSALVTKTIISSQSYANIYNLLNTNLTDPTGVAGRRFIYSREPSITAIYSPGYPLIILSHIKPTISMQTIDGTKRMITWEMEIDIRTSDKKGNGLTHLESLSDELFKILNNQSNRNTLRGYSMYNVTLVQNSTDYIEIEGESIFASVFTLTFDSMLEVS